MPTTNITQAHRGALEAMRKAGNYALFSCFVNGEPASAIVEVRRHGEEVRITPLFVSLTPAMRLTDHDGTEA